MTDKSKTILDLGNIPLVNNLCDTKEESLNCKRYPLVIEQHDDLLMKLSYEVDSDEVFSKYLFKSSVNKPYIQHCKRMWYHIKHMLYGTHSDCCSEYKPMKRIVDIGGNDGTLLKSFKSQSTGPLELINVDASSSFRKENEDAGIEYIQSYWGDIKLDKKADLIVSTNVFQHTPDYRKFLQGIVDNLHGVWVLEFPYFMDTVKGDQFDQTYHEHVYYWLLTPLLKLFKEYGLNVLSIKKVDGQGGSLRIITSNISSSGDPLDSPKSINSKLVKLEQDFDFTEWNQKITMKRSHDAIFLNKLCGRIACFGAAAKGCVYLNSLYDANYEKMPVSYVVDDTPEKLGKYIPGTGLKVMSREYLYEDQPDYLIVLAHNFKDYIIDSLRPHYKGHIITMLPDIQIDDM